MSMSKKVVHDENEPGPQRSLNSAPEEPLTLPRLHSVDDVLAMWPDAIRPGPQSLVKTAKKFNCYRKLGRSMAFTDDDVKVLLDRIRPRPESPTMARMTRRSLGQVTPPAKAEKKTRATQTEDPEPTDIPIQQRELKLISNAKK